MVAVRSSGGITPGAPLIVFNCTHCGMKFQVQDQFAGRQSKCPTCKHALIVPVPAAIAVPAPARIEGPASSLHQAGLVGGVTLSGAGNTPAPASRAVGAALAGGQPGGQRYVVQGEIARGGMGAVLRAVDCDIRREVAVKYLLDQSDARKKTRFVEEAQITGQLEHPNIVPIHELGVDAQKRLFFSMKLVKGRSLSQVLDDLRQSPKLAEREFTLGRLLTIFVNICHALAYAHSRGVIHRDLKPANIMVGDFGEVYVMDWGLAKVLGQEAAPWHEAGPGPAAALRDPTSPGSGERVATNRGQDADLTQDGAILGTPAYMPPEQARGEIAAIDERSDIYSLGAILYEFLTLQPPVDRGGGHMQVLMRVAEGHIVPPEQRVRQTRGASPRRVPPELSAVAL
jgi:serine/threonine protein kinase